MTVHHYVVLIEKSAASLLGFVAVIFVIIVNTLKIRKYKESAYYKITKNPYSAVMRDKGKNGEYLIYQHLKYLEEAGGRFLFNLYITKENNQKTEIDVILIHSKGLFVFESKNFGGWIFGNEGHQNWTQVLPSGRRRNRKNSFYNPIKQNAGHIKYLKRIIPANIQTHSIIVFSDRCVLKDITVYNTDVVVTQCRDVASVLTKIYCQTSANLLTEKEVGDIYNKLHPYTKISREEARAHIENIPKVEKSELKNSFISYRSYRESRKRSKL